MKALMQVQEEGEEQREAAMLVATAVAGDAIPAAEDSSEAATHT